MRPACGRRRRTDRYSLRRGEADEPERGEAREAAAPDEQMSLFAAISAVATDATAFDDPGHDELDEGDDCLDGFELTLAPPPVDLGRGRYRDAGADAPRGEAPPP